MFQTLTVSLLPVRKHGVCATPREPFQDMRGCGETAVTQDGLCDLQD